MYRRNMNFLVLWCALMDAVGAAEAPAPALLVRSRSVFDVQSTLLLNELAGKRRDVSSRLEGTLTLEPVAIDSAQDRMLLSFRLQEVALVSRGAHELAEWQRRGPAWRATAEAAYYAVWHAGRLTSVYLDPTDPADVLNYKRALLSLFQFQMIDGEYKETDVSGECDVAYETISPTVFRKTKRRCAFESKADVGVGVRARRVSRYTLNAARDAIHSLHAEELLYVSFESESAGEGEGQGQVGLKARSWHALTLRSDVQAHPPEGRAALEDAVTSLPNHLVDTPLPLPLDGDEHYDEQESSRSLEDEVFRHAAALRGCEPGEGGTRDQLLALQPLLRALRRASKDELRALLERDAVQELLSGLCRALGLAGTRAAWHAARALLAPGAADAQPDLARHYLEGVALALRPHPDLVDELLALGEEAVLPSVAESALLAAAAAAARLPADGPGAARVRERIAHSLARCRDAACRAVRLRALGNLRRADTAALLVAAAERGARADAEAALSALRRCPARALSAALLERTARMATNETLHAVVRALALDLTTERLCARHRTAVPLTLVRVAHALASERGPTAHELRRSLWQRLDTLQDREPVRALRRLLPLDLRTWDARAHGGTSHVLVRELGWSGGAGGEWRGALRSAQLAARALLLRGRVELMATHPREEELELLAVEVWTRGLEAVAGGGGGGGGGEGEEEAEDEGGPAAGLQVSVGGVAFPPRTLFDGQAELVGHIWAGTGSAPTGVVRALLPLAEWRALVPLQAGSVLAGSAHGSAALALDARGAVSLWHRTAQARLSVRAALLLEARLAVRSGWARLRARVRDTRAARLRIAPDLHFYDGVALCVRTDVDPPRLLRTVELESVCGERSWRVSRNTTLQEEAGAARSLALGGANDAACRKHSVVEPEEDLL